LFLLSLGIAGLFSCLCQYILLKAIETKVPELTNQVADFADKVIKSLNTASQSWSGGVNKAIAATDDTINNDILGWVNTTTTAVNSTLNTFVDKMSDQLNKTFGGTVLYDPIKDVLNCLVTLKIQGVQKGLTWVQDHAHVDFPTVSNDTFSLGTLAKLSNSSSAAELLSDPTSTTRDEITEAVQHLVDKLMSGLRTEAIISTVIILLWVVMVLIGVIRACIMVFGRSKPAPEFNTTYTVESPRDAAPQTEVYPDTAAPPYEYPVNKAAPYTIQPRPFPSFDHQDNIEPQSEKVGQVGARNVADSSRPGHLRASSHGHLAQPSPLDEKRNPFAD
jgi:hypothetical protein